MAAKMELWQISVFLFSLQVLLLNATKDFQCKYNEFKVQDIIGNMSCLPCPACGPGHGLTPDCGSFVKYGDLIECKLCIQGKSYSDTQDASPCQYCGICDEHQTVIRNCTLMRNSNCGRDCVKGFYYSDVTMDCQSCSWCCDNRGGNIESDCKNKGMPSYKQCGIDNSYHCRPRCTNKQYVVIDIKTLKKSCHRCASCAIGEGLHPECTSVLNDTTKSSCENCVPGITFSLSEDSSSCKPCTKCPVGKKVERTCNSTHDTHCGDCLPGFYKDPDTVDLKQECKECSYCCGDDKDIHIKECAAEGMPLNKQCAYTQRSISVCGPKKQVFDNKSHFMVYYIIGSVVLLLFFIVGGVCLIFYLRYKKSGYENLALQASADPEAPEQPDNIRSTGNTYWFQNAGVRVYLPEDDTDRDVYEAMAIAVLWEDSLYPDLREDEVLLSPIIKFCPHGEKLKKPLSMELPHSAFMDTEDRWSLRVLTQTFSDNNKGQEWNSLLESVYVDETTIKFKVSNLAAYVVVGSRTEVKHAKKKMHCAVFATHEPCERAGKPFVVNLYMVDDCEPSLARVTHEEEKLGHHMLSSLRSLYLDTDTESKINVSANHTSEGWHLSSINPQEIRGIDWLNSYKKIPKIEAVFIHEDKTKRDFHCTFSVSIQDDILAEIPVFLYVHHQIPPRWTQRTCELNDQSSQHVNFVETFTKVFRPLSCLPQKVVQELCQKISTESCVTIVKKLVKSITADELDQIRRSGRPTSQASQLLKTLNEKIPDLSLDKFNSALKETEGCDEAMAVLLPFLEENGGVECV